jgi:DNA-binding MarR family transcriptional regulator
MPTAFGSQTGIGVVRDVAPFQLPLERVGRSGQTASMADALPVEPVRASVLAPGDLTTLVELLFFAYRDFTGEADALLETFGLGRAHHRVLHFVRRYPGLRVTDLLGILKITKQSLARVLTPLIDDGWIDSRKDPDDQRARLLVLTDKGHDLAARLAEVQTARVRTALGAAYPGAALDEAQIRRFLFAMIAADDRGRVDALLRAPADATVGATGAHPHRSFRSPR